MKEDDNWRKLVTQVKEKDEFEIFKEFILKLKNEQPQMLEDIMRNMTEQGLIFLRRSIQTQRIKIEGENMNEPRRILKIKKK